MNYGNIIKARPSLLIALLLAWWLACWLATGVWFDRLADTAYREEAAHAEHFVANAVQGFDRIIAVRTGLPKLLARDPALRQMLARVGPVAAGASLPYEARKRRWTEDPLLAATSRRLRIDADDLGLAAVAMIDTAGNCIAASNAGTDKSFVGVNYADRDYFPDTLAGRSGYRITVGKQYGSAGIAFFVPVMEGGRVIGGVASRIDLAPFNNWLASADAFLTDRNGVVMLSPNPALVMHAMAGAPVRQLDAATRQALYRRTDFGLLNLAPWGDPRFPELRRVDGRAVPVILRSRAIAAGNEPVVNVLWPLPQLVELTQQRLVYAGVLGSLGSVLLLLAAIHAARRREQRAMALALAEREQKATQSRDFLDQMVNAIPDPVFVKDRAHRWVLMNNACCELIGQPREKLIGKSDFDFFPEQQARVFWDKDELVFNAGIENVNEEKITGGQGDTRIIITKKSPITTAEGDQFLVGIISDISARKQTERLLRAREREFRTLAENLPDIVIRYDRECRRLYVNPALATMAGAPPDELLGRPPQAHTPLVDSERYVAELRRAMDGGAPCSLEVQVRRANGEPGWYLSSFVPEFDADGQVVGALVVARDITVRRAMEDALAARERELRTLMDNIPDLVLRYDRDCRRIYANPAWERTTGIRCEEIVGTPPVGFGADAKDVLPAYTQLLEDVIASGQAREFELQWPMRDGSMRWYLHRLAAELDETGAVVGAVVISNDVSERKLTQLRLELLEHAIDLSSDAVYLIGENLRFGYVNAAACRALGYSREELLAMGPPDIDPDVDAETARHIMDSTPGGNLHFETRHRARDGRIFPVDLNATHFERDGARFSIAVVRDITERKRIEAALVDRERDFRNLAENLPVAVIRYDAGQHRRYLNRAAERMLHGSAAELLDHVPGGPTVSATPAMIEHYRGKMADVLATDAARELDFVLDALPADRQEHYEVRFVPEHGADGQTTGVLAIWYDITERKRMENQLTQREREFRSLAESSPDSIVRYDRDGRHLYFNDRLLSHLGLASADEAIGKRPGEVWPDGRYAELEQAVARAMAGEDQVDIELIEPTPSGVFLYHQLFVVPERGAGGQIIGAVAFGREITAIREAERKLAHFIDNLPGLAYTFRLSPEGHGCFPYVSSAIEDIYGLKSEEVKDNMTALHALAHPDDQPRIEAAIAESIQTMRPFQIESRVCRPGQPERWLDARSVPEHQPDGSILWYGLMLDITGRKRAEIALRENFDRTADLNLHLERQARELAASREQLQLTEAWYRSILRSAPDGMLVMDGHGVIVQANAQLEALFGYEGRELIGNHVEMLLPTAIRDMHVKKRIDFVTSGSVDRPMASSLNLRACRKDGSELPVDISLSQLPDIAGRVGTICAVIRDITERKRMEDELQRGRLALEDAQRIGQIGSWELDLVSGVLNWSDEALRMFEIAPTLFGASMDVFMNAVHPEDRERVSAAYDASVKSRTAYDVEHRLLFPDGRVKDVRERGETWYDADGRPLRTLGTVQNMTEAKLAEARLRKSRDIVRALAAHRANEHEKERKELAHQIHEDLAQNFAALRMKISMVEMCGESAARAALLKTMHDIAERSIARIRDIVSVLRPTVLDLGVIPALHWLIDDFKGIGFQFDLALRDDILVSDEVSTLLFRAMQEALLNIALHAAATRVWVSLDCVDGACHLRVRDNGCGFDPAEPRRDGSFGLIDLTEQARYLGGDLSIDSSPGRGTVLHIRLPGSAAEIGVY